MLAAAEARSAQVLKLAATTGEEGHMSSSPEKKLRQPDQRMDHLKEDLGRLEDSLGLPRSSAKEPWGGRIERIRAASASKCGKLKLRSAR